MQTCQKICFTSEMKTSHRPVQWRRVSHVTSVRSHSSHTAMLQPLKLGRFLCGLC